MAEFYHKNAQVGRSGQSNPIFLHVPAPLERCEQMLLMIGNGGISGLNKSQQRVGVHSNLVFEEKKTRGEGMVRASRPRFAADKKWDILLVHRFGNPVVVEFDL